MSEQDDVIYTLLGVRADGVAPVVDLIPADSRELLRAGAEALLRDHASCDSVEVWRGAVLVARVSRARDAAPQWPESPSSDGSSSLWAWMMK